MGMLLLGILSFSIFLLTILHPTKGWPARRLTPINDVLLL